MGIAKNCISGQASYSKPTGKSIKQRRRINFMEERKLGGGVLKKIHWRKARVQAKFFLG